MFKKKTFEVYRNPAVVGAFADPTPVLSHNISIGYEAVGHSDTIQASQNAEIIRGVGYHYSTIPPDLTSKDYLRDPVANVTLKVQSIEPFQNGIIPHYEIFLTDTQWKVN